MTTGITSSTVTGAAPVSATAGATGDITPGIIAVMATAAIPGTEVTAITTIRTSTAATAASYLEPTGRTDSPFITWTDNITGRKY